MIKQTKTFKKYKAEYHAEVVDAVRQYTTGHADLAIYEDKSIVKVTGAKAQIDEMIQFLQARFGSPLPGEV